MAASTRALQQLLRPKFAGQWLCPSCQNKIASQTRALSGLSITTRTPENRKPLPMTHEELAPRNKPPKLQHRLKPVGQPEIPKPGDNSHYDGRSWGQKLEDYFESREAARQWLKPAFLPLAAMRHHKGKTFLATPTLYRQESALYFPNLQGYTLADPKGMYDTTDVLAGKVTIVKFMSEMWAAMQCDSYTSPETNPELAEVLGQHKGKGLQVVNINVTEERLKAFFVRWNIGWHRKQIPEEDWSRTFMVRRGITDYTRADIGMSNPKVGHVFLVDWKCKIRWTGCGDASDEEKESLVACVKRLVEKPGSRAGEKENEKVASIQRPKRPMRFLHDS